MAIIITDGLATVDKENTIPEAQRLKAYNVNGEVNVVAIGNYAIHYVTRQKKELWSGIPTRDPRYLPRP